MSIYKDSIIDRELDNWVAWMLRIMGLYELQAHWNIIFVHVFKILIFNSNFLQSIIWKIFPIFYLIAKWLMFHSNIPKKASFFSLIFCTLLALYYTVGWGWLWPLNFLTWIRYTFLEPLWHQESHGICIFFQSRRFQNHYYHFNLIQPLFNSNFVFFEKNVLGSDGFGQNWT